MKARLLLVFALLLVHPSVSAQTPAPMRESKMNLVVSTQTPTTEKINKVGGNTTDLEQLDKDLTIIIFLVAKILAASLIILVICRFFLPIVNRPSQLIIDKFNNATGITEMDLILPGLRQLAREKLILEMKSAEQRIKQSYSTQKTNASSLPQNLPDKILTDLISSWLKFTPEQFESTVKILKIMFPPRGTKVTSILQSQGSSHSKLGITFEISDLQGKVESTIYTVWESVEYQLPQPDLKDRYRELLTPAIRWLASELYCRTMEIAASQVHKSEVRAFCKSALELERLHDEKPNMVLSE